MHAPETRTLRLKDGRDLAYQCWGDPHGRPLHFFHGFPGSRHQAALVHETALTAGVCLIATDRPGMGISSPAPDRQILDWPDDVEQLADHLGHARFGVIGVSCGGPYALACALRLGLRLDYVGLLAAAGPMNMPALRKGQLPMLRVLFTLARSAPWLLAPMLRLDRYMLISNPESAIRTLIRMLTAPDQQLLTSSPTLLAGFARSLIDAYQQGIGGPLLEARLIAHDHELALTDVRNLVHCYVAGQDRHVPPAMSQYLLAQLPHVRARHYPDEGHLSIVSNRFAECLADFLH